MSQKTGKATQWVRTHGFIDSDVFVHYSNIMADGFAKLIVGEEYSYDLVFNNGRKAAINVRPVPKQADPNIEAWLRGDNFGGF